MSLRVALLGGILVLGALLASLVAVVGTRTIHGSVYREAQERANNSLQVTTSLYRQETEVLATRLGSRLGGKVWGDEIDGKELERIRLELDFDLLNACDLAGNPLAGGHPTDGPAVPVVDDPVLRQAVRGRIAHGTVLHGPERLRLEGGETLAALLRIRAATPEAGPGTEQALFQWYAWPLRGEDGRVRALIYGGRALNHRLDLVDELHAVVFGEERYEGKPVGTITVFLGPVRVATNVLDASGRRALGTVVSDEVRRATLENGLIWRARAWVVDSWYLSSYLPLKDPDGAIIGMLYVGLLEAPYDALKGEMVTRFLLPSAIVMLLGLILATLMVARITRPLGELTAGAQRLELGDFQGTFEPERTFGELSRLSQALSRMQQAIVDRDAKLRDQNQLLSETNVALEKANANYMNTLGFVTHELKSPLAAIQSLADLLVDSQAGEVDAEARGFLVRIKRNCEELQDMVKNYLDLSRAERGELQAELREIDLIEDVVEPCVQQSKALFSSRSIALGVETPGELRLHGDPELLRIALGNYMSNAAKYGLEGGRAELRAEVQGDALALSVWNEGSGFTREEREALFKKFSRLANKNTKQKRGSGLGLFLVQQILELHGGSVSAESSPGEWARFTLTLPWKRA